MNLDPFQMKALEDRKGSTWIEAPLGTGKTTTLLAKAEQVENPLTLAFTKRAAKEARGMTFHSFCYSLFPMLTVWAREESLYEMTAVCKRFGIKDQRVAANELTEISWRKCRGLDIVMTPWSLEYERVKTAARALDFDDLLLHGLEYVHTHDLRDRYGMILVDEFQDLNPVQYEILKAISTDNVFAVGDHFQSIYTWRDAVPKLVEIYKKEFHPAECPLKYDWRHGSEILAVLEWMYPRGVEPHGPPGKVEMFECLSPNAEMTVVVKLVEKLKTCDILCRTWAPLKSLVNFGVDGDLIGDPENDIYVPSDERAEGDTFLRSIHSSKGETYDNVIVYGCTDGIWPGFRVADYEEEERLLYVAMGRAKRYLAITSGGSTSRFFCGDVEGKRSVFPIVSRKFSTSRSNQLVEVK